MGKTVAAENSWMQLRSRDKEYGATFKKPFPVGTEYYRPPTPTPEFWDSDFRRISAAGMSIVRVWYSWNWVETLPNRYEFDDLDLLFDTAAKYRFKVWLDTPLGTHMAAPAWMLREHPDMRAVWRDGSVQQDVAGDFSPHGSMTHNFDHPMWRVYVERYLRQLVPRYRDHEAMGIWGTWDGKGYAAAWTAPEPYPPYNDYTIAKYKDWLYRRYTLDELNEKLLRRHRSWEDVQPPRSNAAIVEMLLYRQFHCENMADHLGWMADLVDELDGRHEQRSHGGSYPMPHHETVSPAIDSWGLSHHSADRLTSGDPYSLACEAYGFHWCRAMGRNGRWWNEEIYGSFVGGLMPREKMTIGEESAMHIWLTLIEGGAGAMFWQYRPEYMTFEAPGLSIMALDGGPTERFAAAERTIAQIDAISDHLPLSIPRSDMAIAYSGSSHQVFDFNDAGFKFLQHHRGMYRALWAHSVAVDLVTAKTDWSGYELVYLPNFAVMEEGALARLRGVLEQEQGPRLLADGYFATFAGKGHWSFSPPEGLGDLIDCRIADLDMVNEQDVAAGRNLLATPYGEFRLPAGTSYCILEPGSGMEAVGAIGDRVVGVQSAGKRMTWYGVSLAATGSSTVTGQPGGPSPVPVVDEGVALAVAREAGVESRFDISGDRVVAYRRQSRLGGSLVFLLNLEERTARTTVGLRWKADEARDLLAGRPLTLVNGAFQLELAFGEVAVIHCPDA